MIDGESSSTKSMKNLIAMVSQTDSTALILGETGTGKDIVAQAIHKCSKKKGPLVTVNCAAIPSELLESELFGHEKGSFTGADKQRKGRFEQSSGGSLFLDEIGDMPLAMQVKLLRVLQEGTFFPVGGREQKYIDIRVISATNADLLEKVQEGSFREDLYYRIKGVNIETQPLAERLEDVPVLLQAFLSRLQNQQSKNLQLSSEAVQWFRDQPWPGNVRELDNVIQRALILCSGSTIESEHILVEEFAVDNVAADIQASHQVDDSGDFKMEIRDQENRIILDALQACHGKRKDVAEKLGISPRTLRYKLAKMREQGIEVPA